MEVAHFAREAREVILIGHAGHPEIEGTMGRFDTSFGGQIFLVESIEDVQQVAVRDPERLAFVTQTTLSVDDTALMVAALRDRFPSLQAPRREDICYATQNRQDAVKKLLERCDVLLVVGSRSSSNSNRLRELADRAGIPAIWSTVPTICSANGSMARRPWVSPPGLRRPRCGCSRWCSGYANGARRCRRSSQGARSRWYSACPRRCAADAPGERFMSPGSVPMAPLGAAFAGFAGSRSYNRAHGNRRSRVES